LFNSEVIIGAMFAAPFSISAHATGVTGEDVNSASPVASSAGAGKPTLVSFNNCTLSYPLVSRKFEEQGTVRLQFKVGPDSQLISTKVQRSSGYRKLNNAAVEALSH
jgi:outer membrane biosynthesis protein TonB